MESSDDVDISKAPAAEGRERLGSIYIELTWSIFF